METLSVEQGKGLAVEEGKPVEVEALEAAVRALRAKAAPKPPPRFARKGHSNPLAGLTVVTGDGDGGPQSAAFEEGTTPEAQSIVCAACSFTKTCWTNVRSPCAPFLTVFLF